MADQLRVIGGRNLRRTLAKAGIDLAELKATNAKVAGIVATRGRGMAPVGPTGRLAGSVRPSGTKTQAVVRAGFARIPYAGPIHWGWPKRNIEAQPFLSEAATATEATWQDVYMTFIDNVINQVEGA